jgi:regulator of replication initiation timing
MKSITIMHTGLQRFEIHLLQAEALLIAASKQKNPALYLYMHGARTTFFMLQALAKLYGAMHNKKKLTKLKELFKSIEDAIGAIDYYDVCAKTLAKQKKSDKKIIQYLEAQTREKIQYLNEILLEKKWLQIENGRLKKIIKKLNSADWLSPEKETQAIISYYHAEIEEINHFVLADNFHFDNMEEDVHELRRKIRWLSIYPHAMLGAIQLKKAKAGKHIKKYQTEQVLHSPFNTMPKASKNEVLVWLNKDVFLAMSWLINELGSIKDEGLLLVAIKEALQETSALDEAAALKKADALAGKKQTPLSTLLTRAATVCKDFFAEKNLELLVAIAA